MSSREILLHIKDVRQGKYFEIELDGDGAEVREQIDKIAHDVLANPVIEEYRVDVED